jgi:hypothetical protein
VTGGVAIGEAITERNDDSFESRGKECHQSNSVSPYSVKVMDYCMVVCLKLDFRRIIGVRIITCIFMYLQIRYVKKDNLYVETFDEVEGAHQRVCSHRFSETSREKITKHLLKNFTVPAKLCGEKKTFEISFLDSFLYVCSTKI